MELFHRLISAAVYTILDVLPIVIIIFGFQFLIIRRPIPNLKKVLIGFLYVLIGLAIFIVGLEEALFPLGKLLAEELTNSEFINKGLTHAIGVIHWQDYMWVYFFAAALGFTTTIAEPSLTAIAIKAHSVSGGTISKWGLRIAVGIGAAIGLALGSFRIVTGTPLHYYIIAGYIIVIIQTFYSPRVIIALAYDLGGVTTSTVTVPLVAALGLGLASSIPGRSPLLDGFGLIAFACLFPIITVLAYAQCAEWVQHREMKNKHTKGDK